MSGQHFTRLYFIYCIALSTVVFAAPRAVPFVLPPYSTYAYKLIYLCPWRASPTNPNPISLACLLFLVCFLPAYPKHAGLVNHLHNLQLQPDNIGDFGNDTAPINANRESDTDTGFAGIPDNNDPGENQTPDCKLSTGIDLEQDHKFSTGVAPEDWHEKVLPPDSDSNNSAIDQEDSDSNEDYM